MKRIVTRLPIVTKQGTVSENTLGLLRGVMQAVTQPQPDPVETLTKMAAKQTEAAMPVQAYVRHEHGKWNVYSEKGKHMGSYDSEGDAKKRLQQMEIHKYYGSVVPSDMDMVVNEVLRRQAGSPDPAQVADGVIKWYAAYHGVEVAKEDATKAVMAQMHPGGVTLGSAVASGGFKKVAFDLYEKQGDPDKGSIWVVSDVDGKKWLVSYHDPKGDLIRHVKASMVGLKKTASEMCPVCHEEPCICPSDLESEQRKLEEVGFVPLRRQMDSALNRLLKAKGMKVMPTDVKEIAKLQAGVAALLVTGGLTHEAAQKAIEGQWLKVATQVGKPVVAAEQKPTSISAYQYDPKTETAYGNPIVTLSSDQWVGVTKLHPELDLSVVDPQTAVKLYGHVETMRRKAMIAKHANAQPLKVLGDALLHCAKNNRPVVFAADPTDNIVPLRWTTETPKPEGAEQGPPKEPEQSPEGTIEIKLNPGTHHVEVDFGAGGEGEGVNG